MGWTRESTLGRGGFAFVSKARTDQESSQCLPPVVAVKSVKISESKLMLKEKELLDQFNLCPCILHCFGDDLTTENGEQLYNILLEYASGGCLIDHIKRKGLPVNTVKRYTKSMLIALNHIHKLGYIHCDVKPHNVLLIKEGTNNEETAKLADFGSAIRFGPQVNEEQENTGFRGTVMYAAPESISRLEYLPESDVWAMGCTILQMLTGKAPWKFDKKVQAVDMLFKIGCADEIPEIPSNKNISREAADFLRKCLVKDPKARWKVDMLLDHPFLKMDAPDNRHHQNCMLSRLHLILPRCFHLTNSASVHAC